MQQCDILSSISEIKKCLDREFFDICLDKGTYDAISLCPEGSQSKRRKYIENVADLLEPASGEMEKGLLILTSCNWTESELRKQFSDRKYDNIDQTIQGTHKTQTIELSDLNIPFPPIGFDVLKVIPTPQFQFGGVVGNTVTSIVFQKMKS